MKAHHKISLVATAQKGATTTDGATTREQRTDAQYQALVHRLNRIEGQINGIRGLLDRSLRCSDILVQTAAVVAALHGFERELVVQHLVGTVAKDIRAGRTESIDEFADCLRRSLD